MKYQYKKAPNPTEYSVFSGLGTTPLDLKTIAKDIPCQNACPAKTNVPGYIEQLALGNPDAAYRINQEDNVFPAVLGRVCTRPCEESCRHQWTNVQGPVSICHLKRAAADNLKNPPGPLDGWFKATGKRIAVVGGGPAGLTSARELCRYGHEVVLFEREDHLGGMMVDGIPKFRLPRDVVEREISLIIDSGIELRLGENLDREDIVNLKNEFDAVLVAVGTMVPRNLKLNGLGTDGINEGPAAIDGIYQGLDFMKRYNAGEITSMKGNVVVIGGGFTAVDCSRSCARAARRIVGEGEKVSIVYRRTEHHMAAELEELEEIRNENIDIRTLASPIEAVVENGKLKGVKFIRNIVGGPGEGGKPSIKAVEGSEYIEPCDNLIIAIGQSQDWSVLPEGASITSDQGTTDEKIFVAGDFNTGSSDVIHAVAEGKAAADSIDRYLTGQVRIKKHVSIEIAHEDAETGRYRDHDLQQPNEMPLLDLVKRASGDREVETGFADQEIINHATRCYLCQYKLEIDNDKCIHCDWCIDAAPRDCIKKVSRIFKDSDGFVTGFTETDLSREATFIHIDSNECIRCGKCLRVCPVGAISHRKTTLTPCASPEGDRAGKNIIKLIDNISLKK